MGLLDSKVVIVTGAGGGIGQAIVQHLHEEGATVVATAHSDASAEKVAGLVANSDRFVVKRVDVANEAEVKELVDFTVDQFGALNGIVNNAGVLIPNDVPTASVDEYETTFNVNVKGVFLGCKYALPKLIEAGGGSIVNFGSINSLAAEKQLALYTASKGAVLMLTKAVALDHGGQGVRANALCPGFVDTPLNVPHYTKLGGREALDAALPDWQPIGRPIEPVEIAYGVSFLLSDRSKAITGTDFVIDGGVLSKA